MDTTDPRPQLRIDEGAARVVGSACSACGFPVALVLQRCPLCRSDMREREFGPGGTVSASTCLRVRVPGHEPPFAIAYVDLDDGPRVLVHTGGDVPVPTGSRARLVGLTASGDLASETEVR